MDDVLRGMIHILFSAEESRATFNIFCINLSLTFTLKHSGPENWCFKWEHSLEGHTKGGVIVWTGCIKMCIMFKMYTSFPENVKYSWTHESFCSRRIPFCFLSFQILKILFMGTIRERADVEMPSTRTTAATSTELLYRKWMCEEHWTSHGHGAAIIPGRHLGIFNLPPHSQPLNEGAAPSADPLAAVLFIVPHPGNPPDVAGSDYDHCTRDTVPK